MTEAETIVEALLNAEQEDTRRLDRVFHLPPQPGRLHEEDDEDDDEETIKDILGPDFYDPVPPQQPKSGSIERFDRWANVSIGDRNFCISYLTPVAVYIPGEGIMFTDRDWSTTTSRHIAKWAAEIGMTGQGGTPYKYAELKKRFKRIPQIELTQMFKAESSQVAWSKKEMRQATKFRPTAGYKYVDPEHKIELRPFEPPKEEI
jgi:hypothetical protein